MSSRDRDRRFRLREPTAEEGREAARWRYPPPYDTYDLDEPIEPDTGFFAVELDGELVGFACTGAEARVPGVEEEEGIVDVGYGLRPDLTGKGLGYDFVGAILSHVRERHPDTRLRMSILDWNRRSRRIAERHGFRVVDRVGEFEVLLLE